MRFWHNWYEGSEWTAQLQPPSLQIHNLIGQFMDPIKEKERIQKLQESNQRLEKKNFWKGKTNRIHIK